MLAVLHIVQACTTVSFASFPVPRVTIVFSQSGQSLRAISVVSLAAPVLAARASTVLKAMRQSLHPMAIAEGIAGATTAVGTVNFAAPAPFICALIAIGSAVNPATARIASDVITLGVEFNAFIILFGFCFGGFGNHSDCHWNGLPGEPSNPAKYGMKYFCGIWLRPV